LVGPDLAEEWEGEEKENYFYGISKKRLDAPTISAYS
jgi:hypothetical protein